MIRLPRRQQRNKRQPRLTNVILLVIDLQVTAVVVIAAGTVNLPATIQVLMPVAEDTSVNKAVSIKQPHMDHHPRGVEAKVVDKDNGAVAEVAAAASHVFENQPAAQHHSVLSGGGCLHH
jgi:hypothetical protein